LTPGELADFLVRLAPELAALYILFAGDVLPPEADDFQGATSQVLDLTLRDRIPAWHGRAPCILVNDRRCREQAAGLVGTFADQAELWSFTRVALHEAAHVLEVGPPYFADVGGPDLPAAPPPAFYAAVLADDPERVYPPARPPWYRHGPAWVRIVCHLARRANRAGLYITPQVIVGADYGLSAPAAYARELGDEPARCEGWPFAKILQLPFPEGFIGLWRSDTDRWHEGETMSINEAEPEQGECTVSRLETFLDWANGRKAARVTTYQELVERLAADGCLSKKELEEAEALLRDAGRSVEDLTAAVELRQRRLAWRAAVDKLPDVEREQGKVAEALARADGVLRAAVEKAEAEHDRTCAPLFARQQELQAAAAAAAAGKGQLLKTFDTAGTAELAELGRRVLDLQARQQELTRQVGRAEADVGTAGERDAVLLRTSSGEARWSMAGPEKWATGDAKAPPSEERQAAEKIAAGLRSQLDQVSAELTGLRQRQQALESRKLEP
jgi:hypothetical protein